MVTQTIKQWLSKLFAWWPWGRSSTTGYPQTLGLNTGPVVEKIRRTPMEGPAPLPGGTSVAVEQSLPDGTLDPSSRHSIDERKAAFPFSPAEAPSSPVPVSHTMNMDCSVFPDVNPEVRQERRMEFLRYLVQKGLVHEDFPESQLPEQYRRARTRE